MKERFVIDKTKKYAIYGAGGGGLILADYFLRNGIKLNCFIDRRADMPKNIKGIPVYSVDQFCMCNDSDIIIIVTTKNVFSHTETATMLASRGFANIVYKPIEVLKNYANDDLYKISQAHDSFLIDVCIPEGKILSITNKNRRVTYKDRFFISEEDASVTAWVPAELVFNYKSSDSYEDLNMACFFPLLSLYEMYLGHMSSNVEEKCLFDDFYQYASEWAIKNDIVVDDSLKNSWLLSRYDAYANMERISEFDFDFFIRNAPNVKRGEKSKFYVTNSGRNRLVYLFSKGYKNVPVKMSRQDYEEWINEEAFYKLIHYMENNQRFDFMNTICHPYMQDLEASCIDYAQLYMIPIAKEIYKNLYRKSCNSNVHKTDKEYLDQNKACLRIGCLIDDDGAMSRFIDRLGFSVLRIADGKSEIEILLERLLQQNINFASIEKCKTEHFSHLIIDEKYYGLVHEIEAENIFVLYEYGYIQKAMSGNKTNNWRVLSCAIHQNKKRGVFLENAASKSGSDTRM